MSTHRVFIYCDAPGHPARKPRVAVTNFQQIAPADSGESDAGRWNEVRASRATARDASNSGTTLADDMPLRDLPQSEKKLGRPVDRRKQIRSGYELECRKCGPRMKVVAREETLFTILNVLAASGVSEMSLAALSRRL